MGSPGGGGAPSRRLHTDVRIALVILALCAAVFGATFTFDTIPAALAQGMGAAAFPRLIVAVIAALALVLAWSSRGRADEAREPVHPTVLATVAAMTAVLVLFWLAGMIVAMVLGFIGLGALWGERRWLRLAASAVVITAGIYLVFTKGFAIALPRGLIGDWLF